MGSAPLYTTGFGRPIGPPEQTYRWHATLQGGLLRVQQIWNWRHQPTGGKRGRCGLYTAASRWRLLQKFATVNWELHDGILLITLTYPDSIGHVPYRVRTQQRNLFHRYVETYLGEDTATVWRIEHKERQSGWREGELMPHLHLLVFTKERIPWQKVRQWWATILHWKGPLATDIRRIRGSGRAAAYAAKYAAKGCSSSLDIGAYLDNLVAGRPWGVRREGLIAFHEIVHLEEIPDEEAVRVKELLDRTAGIDRPYQGGSYAAIGRLAELGYHALAGAIDLKAKNK